MLQTPQNMAVPFLRGFQLRPCLPFDPYFLEELFAILATAVLTHREQCTRDLLIRVAAVAELAGTSQGKQQLVLIAGFVFLGGSEHLSFQ